MPDRSGQIRAVLRYRAPSAGPCPNRGGYLPGGVATLHVPGPAGERLLRYSFFIDLGQDPSALTLLCPAS